MHVVTPHSPPHSPRGGLRATRRLIRQLRREWRIANPVLWLYTPLAWPLVSTVDASAVVYDCMDELSGFAGAAPKLRSRERELMAHADVVFTGGHSLYEAKRTLHRNVHPVPSSVDVSHFARARGLRDTPADQQAIPRPRVGFCGVIDERMNLDLVREVAERHPEWHFVMIGPVVKIDPASLPRLANIHYLGMKSYDELPTYLAGWDVAMLPFAHNAATRFISPTKTPEYLAAGCPVVSTSIRDVVRPYGEGGMVAIADTADAFGDAIARSLGPEGQESVSRAESLVGTMSWDRTWAAMDRLVRTVERAGEATAVAGAARDTVTASI